MINYQGRGHFYYTGHHVFELTLKIAKVKKNLLLKIYLDFFGYDPEIGRHVPLIFGVLSIPLVGILSYQIAKNNSFL